MPFSTAVLVLIVLAHAATAGFTGRLPQSIAGDWGFQQADLLGGQWWNVITTMFLSSNTASMLLAAATSAVLLGLAESTVGTRRTAALFLASQLAGVVLYAAMVGLGSRAGLEWPAGMLGATLLAYGLTEILHGYGFLAVFVCACTIRAGERSHGYHRVLHSYVEQLERLLTVIILVLLGGAIARGLLHGIGWREVLVALAFLLAVRPVAGLIGLAGGRTGPRDRIALSFFGVRGIGSLYYLGYALAEGDFGAQAQELWAFVGLVVALSILVHGVSAGPAMNRLDRLRDRQSRGRIILRGTSRHDVQDDLDVVRVAFEGIGKVLQRHTAGNQPAQPSRVGRGQRAGRGIVVIAVGIDTSERDPIAQHCLPV